MSSNEKVMAHLNDALQWVADDDDPKGSVAVEIWAVRDALEMLKEQEEQIDTQRKNLMILLNEQEAVDPTINEYGEVFCGNCGENVGIVGQTIKIVVRMRYCPECGKAVNWKAVMWE